MLHSSRRHLAAIQAELLHHTAQQGKRDGVFLNRSLLRPDPPPSQLLRSPVLPQRFGELSHIFLGQSRSVQVHRSHLSVVLSQ